MEVYPKTEVRSQETEWLVAFGEITCCPVWLVLFSLWVVTYGRSSLAAHTHKSLKRESNSNRPVFNILTAGQ